MEYQIVNGVSKEADVSIATRMLASFVNEYLADGWIPTGGVSIVFFGTAQAPGWLASQAMVRGE